MAELGLCEVKDFTVYHVYIPNKFYDIKIGDINYTKDLPSRRYSCGYKSCIENSAEEERERCFPNYPSRLQCLFVCNKQYVKYWFNYFQKRNQKCGIFPQIYELQVSGEIYWSYAELLRSNVYWNINILQNLQEHEGLLEGEYTVIRKCQPYEFADK